jgi:hypothetical protein
MAAAVTQNPPVKSDSKSAKKKKSKVSAETESSVAALEVAASNGAPDSNSGDGGYESPYIKELYK